MNKYFLLIFTLFICGCASNYSQIQDRTLRIKRSNGINRQEAILIAQNLVIEKSLQQKVDIYKPEDVYKGTTWEKEGEPARFIVPPKGETAYDKVEMWHVTFPGKNIGSKIKVWKRKVAPAVQVDVNAANGNVKGWNTLTN